MSVFELRNTQNRLQFSLDKPPIVLQQKILVELSGGTAIRTGGNRPQGPGGYVKSFSISNPGLFIASYGTAPHTVAGTGSTGSVIYSSEQPGVYVEVYVFGRGTPPGPSDYFEVRDANNVIIFNANTKAFKPIGQLDYAIPNYNHSPGGDGNIGTVSTSWNGPSGRKIAVLHKNIARINHVYLEYSRLDFDGNPVYNRYVDINQSLYTTNNNNVAFTDRTVNRLFTGPTDGTSEPSSYFDVWKKGSALFIDVTNY